MINPDSHDPADLPRALHLSASQERALGLILDNLLERCPAQLLLLAEVSGQLVSVHGEKDKTDPSALGALVAGDLAASQEIARITGQYQHSQLIVREGPESTAFIAEVGEKMVVYMRIKKDVPIGWARLLLLQTGRSLVDIISAPPDKTEKLGLDLGKDELDTLIGDGLDSIWHG
jgi:hypothetical protein